MTGPALVSLLCSITGWEQPVALARHNDGLEMVALGALDQLHFTTLGYQGGPFACSH